MISVSSFIQHKLFVLLNIWVLHTHKSFLSTTWKLPQACPAGPGTWLIIVSDASCGSSVWSLRHVPDSCHGRRIEHFRPAATHKLKSLHFTSVFFTQRQSAALFLLACLLTEGSFRFAYVDTQLLRPQTCFLLRPGVLTNGVFSSLLPAVLECASEELELEEQLLNAAPLSEWWKEIPASVVVMKPQLHCVERRWTARSSVQRPSVKSSSKGQFDYLIC